MNSFSEVASIVADSLEREHSCLKSEFNPRMSIESLISYDDC